MAFTEFYIQTTGSNVNAGNTNADAASVTQTNGGWDSGTGVFTAASGTPFSAVVAGTDWASIYNDGGTLCVFHGRVSAVGGGGASITIDATVRHGSAPSTGATGKSCKIGGAWADLLPFHTGGVLAGATAAVSMRFNWKAGTYANTSNNRAISVAPGSATRVVHRGYNTTAGDITVANTGTLARPVWSFTTGQITWSGGGTLETMEWTSQVVGSNGALNVTTAALEVIACKGTNSATNANSSALRFAVGGCSLSQSELIASTTATGCLVINTATASIIGNRIQGGVAGISVAAQCTIAFNEIFAHATNGIASSATCYIFNNSFYGAGATGSAIDISSTSVNAFPRNNIFVNYGTAGIRSSGGTTGLVRPGYNAYYDTNVQLSGFKTDYSEPGAITLVENPYTSSTDFRIASAGSLAYGGAYPGTMPGQTYSGALDVGAVQRVDDTTSALARIEAALDDLAPITVAEFEAQRAALTAADYDDAAGSIGRQQYNEIPAALAAIQAAQADKTGYELGPGGVDAITGSAPANIDDPESIPLPQLVYATFRRWFGSIGKNKIANTLTVDSFSTQDYTEGVNDDTIGSATPP